MTTVIARTRGQFDQWRREVDQVAVVLTMGALHAGHASLITAAQRSGLPVVLTVFVNPTQFGPNEDLDRYPRTEADDIALAKRLGVDCVWLPQVDEIYPEDDSTSVVEPGELGQRLEGAARPGHFTGVLTVVNRFFEIIRPSVAVFGKKDRQQLTLIAAMVRARHLPIEIIAAETVREADGLALSSRNRFLDASDRAKARSLSQGLAAAVEAGTLGNADDVRRAAMKYLHDVDLDYLVITDQELCEVDPEYRGPAIALVAARVGGVRLIDNMDLQVSGA